MCRNKFGKLKDDEDDGDGANNFLKFPKEDWAGFLVKHLNGCFNGYSTCSGMTCCWLPKKYWPQQSPG